MEDAPITGYEPKFWKNNPSGGTPIYAEDLNRIESGILGLTQNMQEVFQSVSNGKKKIASAITDKGITTEPDATFSEMAENVKNIPTGGGMIPYIKLADLGIDFHEGEVHVVDE